MRCSRCKETWLARPEDAVELVAAVPAMAAANQATEDDAAAQWDAMAREESDSGHEAPEVESPSTPPPNITSRRGGMSVL